MVTLQPNVTLPDSDVMVSELNKQEVIRLIPLIIYLILICVGGLLGNALVLFVYKTKYGPSNCRTFLLFLSAIDLFSCSLGIPFEIIVVLQQFTFRNETACKMSVLLNTWPTLTSGFVLLVIAIDRYRKICHPFGWQMSLGYTKPICVLCVILGAAFSWLSPVIYGVDLSKHPVYNVTISECAETEEMKTQTVLPLVNNIAFAVLFVGALISVTILYCFIGAGVRAHAKRRDNLHFVRPKSSTIADTSDASEMTIRSGLVAVGHAPKQKSATRNDEGSEALFCSDSSETKTTGVSSSAGLEQEAFVPELRSIDASETESRNTQNLNRKSVLDRVLSLGRYSFNTLSRPVSSLLTSGGNQIKRKSTYRKSHVERQKAQKTTFVMFLISVAFIVSYLPLLIILLIRSTHTGFVEGLSDHSRAAYKFFLRSYYLNCVVNPVIYGLWDKKFRKSAKRFFSCNRIR